MSYGAWHIYKTDMQEADVKPALRQVRKLSAMGLVRTSESDDEAFVITPLGDAYVRMILSDNFAGETDEASSHPE